MLQWQQETNTASVSLPLPEVTSVINMLCILPELVLYRYQCACYAHYGFEYFLNCTAYAILQFAFFFAYHYILELFFISIHKYTSFQLLFEFSILWIFPNLYYHSTKLFYTLKCWNLLLWHIERKHSWLKSMVKFLLQDIKKPSNLTTYDHHQKYVFFFK